MIKKELLKGVVKPLVLSVLRGGGKMYGYEITQQVEKRTGGKIKLSYGGLYPILHSLEAEGVLLTETRNVSNRVRKYYFLTPGGNAKADEYIGELEEFVNTIQQIINPNLSTS